VKLATGLGVTFNYCEVLRREREDDHILTNEQAKEFYVKYLAYKKKGAPIMHSIPTIKYMMKWPKPDSNIIYTEEKGKYPKGSYVPCVSGDLHYYFDLDGRMYACNGTWDDGLNYFEVGFDTAWDYLKKRKCHSCQCIGYVEMHSLLGLYPESILHGLKSMLRL
jgi:hypothetical protein